MVLSLVIAESAIQLVPAAIQSHPQIKQYARRRQKNPDEVLLDRAFHNVAMKRLARVHYPIPVETMGRPDIVHNTLLQILETPLNWEGQLRVFVHTQDDLVIWVNPLVRLPKNYTRFVGLIEQLFQERQVPRKGEALLRVERLDLPHLIRRLRPTMVFGLSRLGQPLLMRKVAERAGKLSDPAVLIGGFPRGHFSEMTRRITNEVYSVDREPLDAWVVAGRFVYDFEWSLGIAENRVKPQATK
jgi:rRNA small subunit pseudouridine methyltransferase Nep1